MKKYIKNIVTIFLFALLIVSCNNNEEHVFDKSASQRIDSAINENFNALTAAEHGWVLEYYPENNQSYGGFVYTTKFNDTYQVDVKFELQADLDVSESSEYNIIAYGGPVLSFNTYNSLMHFFATPSAAEYNAKGGDYEFLLLSNEIVNDKQTITVKGRTTGNIMEFTKLSVTPKEYIEKVLDIQNFLSQYSYALKFNNKIIDFEISNRHVTIHEEGKDPIEKAFVYTDRGIKLYEAVEIDGTSVREFILSKEDKEMKSLDGQMVVALLRAPFDVKELWSIVVGDTTVSDSFFTTFTEVFNANKQIYNERLSLEILFGDATIRGVTNPSIIFYSRTATGGYTSQYVMSFGGVVDQPMQLSVKKVTGGFNWKFYSHLAPMVDFITENAPYTAELNSATNPTQIKLTSVSNPSVWFYLEK